LLTALKITRTRGPPKKAPWPPKPYKKKKDIQAAHYLKEDPPKMTASLASIEDIKKALLRAKKELVDPSFRKPLDIRLRADFIKAIRTQKQNPEKWTLKVRQGIETLKRIKSETQQENLRRIQQESPP
ncbi:unnamed protein product, partial [Amoebophrya sp. A25]